MKVHSITDYNNVFQTAPENQGIRLELAKPSTLSLVVGHTGQQGLKGFILTRSLQLDRWYYSKYNHYPEKRVKVALDGRILVDWPERGSDIHISILR